MSDSLWPYELQHARLSCPSPFPGVCSNSCPLSQWCHSTFSSSVTPFSSYLQSFPASGSFPMSQLFLSGGQSIGASASGSVLLLNIQDWFPLGLTGLISLLSKGLSRVISSTTVWKYQFFSAQLFLWSNSHIHTWLLEQPQLWLYRLYTKVEKYSFNLWYLCTTFRVIRVVMYAHNYGQPVKVTLCLLHWDEIYTYIWMGYK